MIINIDWKGKTFRVVGADKENNFTYDEEFPRTVIR